MEINGPRSEDVFPVKKGDIPASYVSLPEGIQNKESYSRKGMFFFVLVRGGKSHKP